METENNIKTIKIQSKNVILISDIHFGWNTSSEEWQGNMHDYFENWFIPYLEKQKELFPDAVLFCLGDVYHDRKSIDIDALNMCINIFETLSSIVPVYIINGNHDLSKKTNSGTSSLRSLDNISNLTIIQEPKMIQFIEGRKNISKILAIPYLGDCNKENSYLVKYSGKADFAFMHTDISKMKFDNGMTVVGAVDADKFSGRVISGHIHKRQETKKVIYVGSPYHLSKSDIGNTKGIYRIDLTTGEFEFTENKYSPIFNRIDITLFMNFTEKERYEAMNNNYIDIMSDEETNKKFKMTDVYEIIDKCTARRAEIKTAKSKDEINAGTDEDCAELSISELIVSAVDGLENTEEQEKETLKKMALKYLKEAQDEMNI